MIFYFTWLPSVPIHLMQILSCEIGPVNLPLWSVQPTLLLVEKAVDGQWRGIDGQLMRRQIDPPLLCMAIINGNRTSDL